METRALTTRSDSGLAYTLENVCVVRSFPDEYGSELLESMEVLAKWDTGAACSMITEELAFELGLVAQGEAELYNVNGSAE